jgi:hypothetical protein
MQQMLALSLLRALCCAGDNRNSEMPLTVDITWELSYMLIPVLHPKRF